MVFSSLVFVFFFLPVTLAAYYISPRRLKTLTITLASFVFYGWWRPDFTLLMLFSSVVDYVAGRLIGRAQDRGGTGKVWLLLSLAMNLGLLGYFKYANFVVDVVNDVLPWFDRPPVKWADIILPVGISFYTFQTMSYTIDVYWKRVRRSRNFIDFLAYVTMFPQLVAGPIVRYISVEDQLLTRTHSFAKFTQGIVALQCGLAKKLLIADVLAPVADAAFAGGAVTPAESWIGIVAYAFQIYFDFSGYSDMAIGLGLMIGFRFPINFDRPYSSKSVTEFWRRWHISLSTWLRDYLYIPLGGNRHGVLRTYANLIITMLLGGLWHGANWTFIAWGAYQGLWLVVEKLNGGRPLWWFLPRPLRVVTTFLAALVGWVWFRANSMEHAVTYLGAMFNVSDYANTAFTALDVRPLHIIVMAAGAIVTWGFTTTQNIVATMSTARVLLLQPLFIVALLHLMYQQNVPFLYFQF